jgi:hypothetical protein
VPSNTQVEVSFSSSKIVTLLAGETPFKADRSQVTSDPRFFIFPLVIPISTELASVLMSCAIFEFFAV